MVTPTNKPSSAVEHEFATFYVGDSLIGIDIRQVQEINRNLQLTRVPHAPPEVRGVISLRGDVVTVLDLRIILGLDRQPIDRDSRNVIANSGDERIGLLIDRIADVVRIRDDAIASPPANLRGLTGRFFSGVYRLDVELLLLLNVEQVLSCHEETTAVA